MHFIGRPLSPRLAVAGALFVATLHLTVPPLAAQGAWEVTPVVTIGSFDGAVTFGSIMGVAVRESGDILVLDRLEGTVSVFDPDGLLLHKFGQKGEGPGELSDLVLTLDLTASGETVIPDLRNRRVSFFDEEYAFTHSFQLGMFAATAFRWATLGDLILKEVRPLPQMAGMDLGGPSEAGVMALARNGEDVGMLVTFHVPEVAAVRGDGKIGAQMFAESGMWTVVDGEFLVHGTSGRYRLEILDAAGEVVGMISKDVERMAVTEEMRRDALDTWRAQMAESELPATALDMMAEPTFADSLPAIGSVHEGPSGTVLVLPTRTPGGESARDSSAVYDVYAIDGTPSGTIELPPRVTLRAARSTRLYCVAKDEYDVETVVVFEVRPPAG